MRLFEIDRFDPQQELIERLKSEFAKSSTEIFLKWKTLTNNFNTDLLLDEHTTEILKKVSYYGIC